MKKLKQFSLLFLFSFLFQSISIAQVKEKEKPEHKIIFQLTSGDTTAHKQLMKQFNNILFVSPTTKIEVVCHGAGLDMLVTDKTIVADKIKALKEKGIVFNACEFSIKERKVDRNKIITEATYVSAGIIEIVSKQEQGWSYIKAGN
jgi:intracellular sulfur oxidation DsrE/DsrF family protein